MASDVAVVDDAEIIQNILEKEALQNGSPSASSSPSPSDLNIDDIIDEHFENETKHNESTPDPAPLPITAITPTASTPPPAERQIDKLLNSGKFQKSQNSKKSMNRRYRSSSVGMIDDRENMRRRPRPNWFLRRPTVSNTNSNVNNNGVNGLNPSRNRYEIAVFHRNQRDSGKSRNSRKSVNFANFKNVKVRKSENPKMNKISFGISSTPPPRCSPHRGRRGSERVDHHRFGTFSGTVSCSPPPPRLTEDDDESVLSESESMEEAVRALVDREEARIRDQLHLITADMNPLGPSRDSVSSVGDTVSCPLRAPKLRNGAYPKPRLSRKAKQFMNTVNTATTTNSTVNPTPTVSFHSEIVHETESNVITKEDDTERVQNDNDDAIGNDDGFIEEKVSEIVEHENVENEADHVVENGMY